ncbi:MAG: MYXO-CTERM sorting domain-containing protein, partial [Pseudomonadota bacterium]
TVDFGLPPNEGRAFGESCENHTDCKSGVCAPGETGRFCSKECSPEEECPIDYYCSSSEICLEDKGQEPPTPDKGEFGDICTGEEDCGDDLTCAPNMATQTWVCTYTCTMGQDGDCPPGSACEVVGSLSVCSQTSSAWGNPSDEGGGCTIGNTPGSDVLWILLGLGLLIVRRRRVH